MCVCWVLSEAVWHACETGKFYRGANCKSRYMHKVIICVCLCLQNWELVVLSKLKWNVTAVTGFDYVDHLLERFTWGDAEARIRRHALTLVAISYTGW